MRPPNLRGNRFRTLVRPRSGGPGIRNRFDSHGIVETRATITLEGEFQCES